MPRVAAAQNISIDGRFSPAQTLVGPNYAITANLGKPVGNNLFHSFGAFGLSTGERATFSGPATTQNVVGRVTGGAQSSINGILASTITGANLYLINPSGIVFGPNAAVNVSGSFHASTADYLRMSDGARFQATNPDASTLSAAPPAAFGFLTATPRSIAVNGSTLAPGPQPSGAAAPNLGLVAGPVAITGGTLRAPAGTIQVTGVASTGEVPVDPRNTAASTVTSFGPVDIKGRSTLDASNFNPLGSGGSVFIRSGTLTIDASTIAANNSGSGPGGVVFLRGEDQVTLINRASVNSLASGSGNGAGVILQSGPAGRISVDNSTVLVNNTASGDSGNLSVSSGQLTLTNGAALETLTSGSRDAGNISISVGGTLSVNGGLILSTALGPLPNPPGSPGNAGQVTVTAGTLTVANAGLIASNTSGAGNGGTVSVTAGNLSIASDGTIVSNTFGAGNGGNVAVAVADGLSISGTSGGRLTGIASNAESGRTGNAGKVAVTAGALTILSNGEIASLTFGSGNGGNVSVSVAGQMTIDATSANTAFLTGVSAQANRGSTGNSGNIAVNAETLSIVDSGAISSSALGASQSLPASTGSAGTVSVTAGTLSIASNGIIVSSTFASGSGGRVSVTVRGQLTIDGTATPANSLTGISASSAAGSTGNAGSVTVNSGILSLVNGGQIASAASRPSNNLPASTGNAGQVTVTAGTLTLANAGLIGTSTFGPGNAGGVFVNVADGLSIIGTSGGGLTGIVSNAAAARTGNAGNVAVSAGTLTIASNGQIASDTFGSGRGGSVSVTVSGQLMMDGTAGLPNLLTGISANSEAGSTGNAGDVTVRAGALSIVDNSEIASFTLGSGNGGSVSVGVARQAEIDATSANINFLTGISSQANPGSIGNGGTIRFSAGSLALTNHGQISATTFGPGASGDVTVDVAGDLVINGIASPSAITGIFARTRDPNGGDAGRVNVAAGNISILNSGLISTSTVGRGAAGEVSVNASGALIIDGAGTPSFSSGIASSANAGTGNAGRVTVTAGSLSLSGGGTIQTVTLASGNGGDLRISTSGNVFINGSGALLPIGILSNAQVGSTGRAGAVTLSGQNVTVSGGGLVSSGTAGAGDGGTVRVTAGGRLSLSGAGSGIIASATSSASGNAGSVVVAAPQITIATGAEIASTTTGTGAGGSVDVTTPGALVLDGAGDPSTEIAASAIGPRSGAGGSVIVNAGSLTVEGGAQIASSTAGPGKGGDVNVMVASDIVLPDPGPQITARSTGSGDAGSITVRATRLLLSNGAAISTEAETSTASGGNITLHVRDFLYLVSSEITTSVKGETGNGGNITIDPQLVILNHSRIVAEAIEGHGGNITITAGEFIPSSDSIISASSQLGISGTIEINGPRVDVNGALVVLSSELRGRAAVLREACAARSDRPISSLVEAGRGGLPQDPEATLPALYIAGRDVSPGATPGANTIEADGAAVQTAVHLTMRCSG